MSIEAMKMVLDAWENPYGIRADAIKDAIEALRKALAQPEQEPVALSNEWISCVKLPIVVHVRKQRDGETHISTREGITPVLPDDLIMRGVAGEVRIERHRGPLETLVLDGLVFDRMMGSTPFFRPEMPVEDKKQLIKDLLGVQK